MKQLRANRSYLQAMFQKYDLTSSGAIDSIDFSEILRRMHINVSATDMMQLFNRFDMDGNNKIEYAEFVRKLDQW